MYLAPRTSGPDLKEHLVVYVPHSQNMPLICNALVVKATTVFALVPATICVVLEGGISVSSRSRD